MGMIDLKKAGWKRIEKSRKTLIDGKQKKLTILECYDLHDSLIVENRTTYNDVHLKYDRVVEDVGFEGNMSEWETDEVFIDGKKISCIDVYDIKGNNDRATIRIITGQG